MRELQQSMIRKCEVKSRGMVEIVLMRGQPPVTVGDHVEAAFTGPCLVTDVLDSDPKAGVHFLAQQLPQP